MFQLLSTIALKFGICLYNVKKYAQQYIKNINRNIFNNFLIAESRRTRTHFFQKLPSLAPAPSPAPAPASQNAPVLHSSSDVWNLMPACLMWLVWKERDSYMFEKDERPLWIFGIHWLLPYTLPTLLFGWRNWFRKHSPDVWNLMPACLMWLVWKERDSHMFEDAERSLDQL